VGYPCANFSLPILYVLDLGPMYATDRRQTKASFNAPPIRGGGIITNSIHLLHILFPPKVDKHYSTRPRGHCYQLPRKTSVLDENNFFYHVLYRDILSFKSSD